MTDQKDNYIPDENPPRRRPVMPNRPADEGDEDVLAGIARQHASRLGLDQTVRQDSPVVSTAEPPLRKPIEIRSSPSPEVFLVRQARRKSQHASARGESARRLIIHLAVVAALTGLAVALFFLTRG